MSTPAAYRGAGGLPVGTAGRAVTLLSGGIDSPVSSFMIAKRGVALIPVHFFAPPYTSELAKQKVLELAERLLPYCGKLTVEIVPFTEIQEAIRDQCPEMYFTLIMRRFMMRIAEKIADSNGAKALVTGENLGQVASQTMEALRVTEDCVSLPVLRPLIGMDKEEIISIARRIDTFELSIQHMKTAAPSSPQGTRRQSRTWMKCARPKRFWMCRALSTQPSPASNASESAYRKEEPVMAYTAEIIAVGTELLLGNVAQYRRQGHI